MPVDVIVDFKDIKSIKLKFDAFEKELPGATAAAVNRTMSHVRKILDQEVRKRYAIKSKDVKGTFKEFKATRKKPVGSIVSIGRTLTIMHHFEVTPASPILARLGVSYTVKAKIKKGRKQAVKTAPKAFIQRFNGSVQVAKREGKERYPVTVLRTISVPQMISSEKVHEEVNKLAGKKLQERLEHEMKVRVKKIAARRVNP